MSLTDWIGGSESESKSYIDPNQQPYLDDLYTHGQELFNSGRSPVAEMSPEMMNYLKGASNFAGNAGGMSGQAWQQGQYGFGMGQAGGDYLNTILQSGGFQAPQQNGVNMNTINSLIDNDALNAQITGATRDIYRNLDEQQLPGIASGAVTSGNAGSTRRGVAEGIAMRGANDAASDVAAQMRGQAYNQAVGVAANQAAANQGAQLSTNGMNASLGSSLFNTGMGMGFQGLGQGYDMGAGAVGLMGDAANMSQDYWQQVAMAPWTKLGLYQQTIGAPTVLNQSSSTSTNGILPALGQFAAGVGEGAAGAAKLSDARLKTNIEPVAGTLGGFQLYRWDWTPEAEALGVSGSETGVIAQEVAAVRPEAVTQGADGYLRVNYAALGAE